MLSLPRCLHQDVVPSLKQLLGPEAELPDHSRGEAAGLGAGVGVLRSGGDRSGGNIGRLVKKCHPVMQVIRRSKTDS